MTPKILSLLTHSILSMLKLLEMLLDFLPSRKGGLPKNRVVLSNGTSVCPHCYKKSKHSPDASRFSKNHRESVRSVAEAFLFLGEFLPPVFPPASLSTLAKWC